MFQIKNRPPSNYHCVICGRNTNDKKYFVDEWGNYFFACSNCKKVWCTSCMGQLTKLGAKKTFKLGKKGKMSCIACDSFIPVMKNPFNLPFVQEIPQSSTSGVIVNEPIKYCALCGHEISHKAKFCENCGGEQ
ncbi:MAG: hypothetical protein ACFFAS_16585 [Promethearchaeota archaeon]